MSLFWEHSCRAAGARARGPATTPNFRPFCESSLGLRCRLRHDGNSAPAARSPRADAALVQGATDGQHGHHRAEGCPQIGSQHMQQGYTHPLQGLAGCGQSAPHNTSLARVYSAASGADTSDSLRCDARSTRRAAGTRAPPHHTHTGRTACLCAVRIRASYRGPAPALWVLQASTRSRRARARVRVRVSQGPSLSRPVFRYTTEWAGRLEGARHTD